MKICWLHVILSVIGVLAALLAVSQLIMAIYSRELGRVIFYFVISALSVELAVLSILKLKNRK